jgi:hypothetical protein
MINQIQTSLMYRHQAHQVIGGKNKKLGSK